MAYTVTGTKVDSVLETLYQLGRNLLGLAAVSNLAYLGRLEEIQGWLAIGHRLSRAHSN
jgi:hypothetical protein